MCLKPPLAPSPSYLQPPELRAFLTHTQRRGAGSRPGAPWATRNSPSCQPEVLPSLSAQTNWCLHRFGTPPHPPQPPARFLHFHELRAWQHSAGRTPDGARGAASPGALPVSQAPPSLKGEGSYTEGPEQQKKINSAPSIAKPPLMISCDQKLKPCFLPPEMGSRPGA